MENLEKMKTLNIQINLVMGIVMSFTSPVIHVAMIQAISADFYKIVMFTSEIISIFIFFYIDKRDKDDSPVNLKKARLYFLPIVVSGCTSL